MKKNDILFCTYLMYILFGCNSIKQPLIIKIWPSIDNKNIVLKQNNSDDPIIIDHINNAILLTKIKNDTLIKIKEIAFIDKIIDANLYKDILVLNSEQSLIVYDVVKSEIINKIELVGDSITIPYSIHKYFGILQNDSFIFIENYCFARNNNPLGKFSYPIEKKINKFDGKITELDVKPSIEAQRYFLKTENYVSRVMNDNYSFYTYLNYDKLIKYNHLTKSTEEIMVDELVARDIYLADTNEFYTDFFTYNKNVFMSSTSNQGLVYCKYDNTLLNFKLLGNNLHDHNKKRQYVLQKIDLNGHVKAEYSLTDANLYNLLFVDEAIYIETLKTEKNKKTRYYERINL